MWGITGRVPPPQPSGSQSLRSRLNFRNVALLSSRLRTNTEAEGSSHRE